MQPPTESFTRSAGRDQLWASAGVVLLAIAGTVAASAHATTVLVLSATALAVVWTWRSPRHLAWLVGFLLPVQVINGMGNAAFEALHIALVGLLILRYRPRLDTGISRLILAFAGLLLAIPFLRLVFTLTRQPDLSAFKFFGVTTAAVIVASLLAQRTDAHRLLVSGLLAGATVSSVVALGQAAGLDWVRTFDGGPNRYPGLAIQVPGLSWHLMVAIIIAVGTIATASTRAARHIAIGQLVICGAALIVCGAQGGPVGLLVSALVFFVLRGRATMTKVRARPVAVAVTVAAAGMAVIVVSGLGASSLAGLGGDPAKGYENEIGRVRSIRYGVEQLIEHPVAGTSTEVYDRDHEVRPHFLPLNLSVETGFVGFLVGSGLVLLVAATLLRGPPVKSPSALAGASILAGLLVQTALTPAGPFAEVEAVSMLLIAIVAVRGGSDLFGDRGISTSSSFERHALDQDAAA